MEENRELVPFSIDTQMAIVGHMLRDFSFFLKCVEYVPYQYFAVDPDLADLVRIMYQFYRDMPSQRQYTVSEIDHHIAWIFSTDNKMRNAIQNKLKISLAKCTEIGLDLIARDMTGWIKLVKCWTTFNAAKGMLNNKEYAKVEDWFKTAVQDITSTSFNKSPVVDFGDTRQFYKKRVLDREGACTLGHPLFDELVMDNSSRITDLINKAQTKGLHGNQMEQVTRGGLMLGDSTVLLGPTNSGKTTAVLTIVSWNLLMGKEVLYIPMEQKPDDLKDRMMQSMLNLNRSEVSNDDRRFRGDQSVADARDAINFHVLAKHLVMAPFIKAGEMYVENVINMIRVLREDKIARMGKGFDLVVADYPGKLKSKAYIGKKSGDWAEIAYVYEQFMTLGLECNHHSILPAQTNRTGAKVGKGAEDRMIDETDIGKSFDITTMADNVISINRSKEDIERRTVRFHIAKCRAAEKGKTFLSATEYDKARTHGLNLAAMVLGPSQTMDQKTFNEAFPMQQLTPAEKEEHAKAKSLLDEMNQGKA